MTEPIPQWKYIQQLEARVKELELEVVQLKNRNFIDSKKEVKLLSNPDDIAIWTAQGLPWRNYNNTFKHTAGVIYSYDTVIAKLDDDGQGISFPTGDFTKTTLRRQSQVKASFAKLFN